MLILVVATVKWIRETGMMAVARLYIISLSCVEKLRLTGSTRLYALQGVVLLLGSNAWRQTFYIVLTNFRARFGTLHRHLMLAWQRLGCVNLTTTSKLNHVPRVLHFAQPS